GLRMNPADIIHVPGLGFDGQIGYSVVQIARQSIGSMIAAGQYQAALWGNSARPSGLLNYPGQLSENAKANLSKSFSDLYSGSQNSGRVAILEEGLQFQTVSFSPKDAEFLGLMQWSTDEVARWFNISPVFLHSLGRATWSNLEQMSMLFAQQTLRPWL